MTAPGKVCLSVIEARNVYADTVAEPNFYVRLRTGASEVKTDVIQGSLSPKFLKDVRLNVLNPEQDVLKIELLQVGPRGDLVVGSEEVMIRSFALRGTFVHWFELKTTSREVGAELCMVLRYIAAGGNRSVSPSYAIAARQERERASQVLPPLSTAKMSDSQQAAVVPVQPAPVAPPPGPPQPRTPPRQPQPKPAPAPPVPRPASSSQPKKGRRRLQSPLPMPTAILGGMLVGALVYMLRRQPAVVQVHEEGLLCTVGTCDYNYIARRKRELGLL